MTFSYNTHGVFFVDSMTALSRFPANDPGDLLPTGRTSDLIVHLSYATSINLESGSTGPNTCRLTFGPARVLTDTYNAHRDYAEAANLTVTGNQLTWCWTRGGHDGGDCQLFHRSR